MPKKNHSIFLENSIAAILSAIEIYNKPDFKYREEIFTILSVNAWELLLKAKILKDNSDELNSIYIYKKNGDLKKNRNGSPLTIEIFGAMNKLSLQRPIKENLNTLIEIRDSATHFYNDDSLDYLLYTLGAACLKNYQRLVKEWFNKSLLKYNFYIMPLGFSPKFKTLTMVDIDNKPKIISELLKSVSETKTEIDESKGYYFTCEISAKVISARKIIEDPDITVSIDPETENAAVIIRNKYLVDQYPLTYREIQKKVKKSIPKYNYKKFVKVMSAIKGNKKYSAYNFRDKKKEKEYEKTGRLALGTPCIYNHDALNYVMERVRKYDVSN